MADTDAQVADIVGSHVEPDHAPARVGDVRHSMASIERARGELGYDCVAGVLEACGLERGGQ